MKNKKAQITNIIWVVGILFVVLLLGIGLLFGTMVVQWTFNEAVPELSNLGVVGDANLTEIASYTLSPVNSVVQSFSWLIGVIYIIGLMACVGFAVAFKMTGSKWLIGFFIACMFLLVVSCIFISNIYEEFYNDGSEVGTMLHQYTLLSWLILYSPAVFSVVGFICGIIMFSGEIDDVGETA